MLRSPTLLALLTLLGATAHALAADDVTADVARATAPDLCRGVSLERFERDLPADTRRYAIGGHLARPFATLWEQARRPTRPGSDSRPVAAMPDAVTVYAQQKQPLLATRGSGPRSPNIGTIAPSDVLIAYRAGDCVLAVLTLSRDRLSRLLRERLGQSV
jgi:hypothetical protein